MKKSIKSIGYLTGLKIIGSSVGLVYAVLQVRYFGATATVDAFFVAMSGVYLIMSLTQGGQLAEVFMPEYLNRIENGGKDAGSALLSAVINRIVVFLLIGLIIIYLIAPWIMQIMALGLEHEYRVLSIALFRVSLVLILFNIVASFVNTTLNAEQIYGRSEWTSIVNGIISIIILVSFFELFGIWVLLYALFAGKIFEFGLGLIFLKKIGFKYQFIWNVPNYNLKNFFSILFSTSGYVGATQFYNIVLTAMASYLPAGSFALFNYTNQLSTKTQNILVTPVSTVFFSKFSGLVTKGRENLSSFLKLPIMALSILTFVQFCFALLLGEDILRLLWSERTLSDEEYKIAYIMLSINLLGVIFSSIGMIFRKSVVAMQGAKKLYKGWTSIQILTAAYSFLIIYYFGVYGLASVPVVNMALMAGVSIYLAFMFGLLPLDNFTSRIWLKLFSYLVISLSAVSSIMFMPISDYSITIILFLKGAVLLITMMVIILLFFKRDIYYILSVLKK